MDYSSEILKFNSDIVWSLPLLFQSEIAWGAIYKTFSAAGVQNLPKIRAYGSSSIAWTGGRTPVVYREFEKEQFIRIFDYLNSVNAIPTLVFTYSRVTKDDLNDKYANFVLDLALEYGAHFIVSSDLLKDYIKNKDSNAHITASVTKSGIYFQGETRIEEPTIENETRFYNKLLKEYDLVVVRPEYSKFVLPEHPELIDDISRIEVLINQGCIQNCPLYRQHCYACEDLRLTPYDGKSGFSCIKSNMHPSLVFNNNVLLGEDDVKKLIQLGVKHLKLQGRCLDYTPQMFAMMFHSFMFNQFGPSCSIIQDVAQVRVGQEAKYFFDYVFGE